MRSRRVGSGRTGGWVILLGGALYSPGCTQTMPPFSTSRIVAGGPITGDVFKCHLIPIDEAINLGIYDGVVFDAAQRAQLDAIFPTGVCDYAQGDARKP